MDFSLTSEQKELQSVAREFAQKEMTSVAKNLEEKKEFLPDEWFHRYAEMGFLGININKKYEGLGLSNFDALLVLEEFAKVSSLVAWPIFESTVGPIKAIEHFANEDLKKRVIPEVCRGNLLVAVTMSEPNAGSALTDLTTKAEEKDDHLVVNGMKRWCSGAGHAQGYVVYCRMSKEPGAKGIGAVYVEKDTEGLSFGKQEELMGFNGVPSADIFFDNVKIPKENIVVGADGGFKKIDGSF